MKKVDLGYKENSYDSPIETKSNKKEVHYPEIHMYDHVPKEFTGFDVGDVFEIKAKVKITSKRISESERNKTASMDIAVMSMEFDEKKMNGEDDLGNELKRQLKK